MHTHVYTYAHTLTLPGTINIYQGNIITLMLHLCSVGLWVLVCWGKLLVLQILKLWYFEEERCVEIGVWVGGVEYYVGEHVQKSIGCVLA